MEENRNQRGIIDNLKPKTAFKAGLFSGLLIVIVIGFFVLLGMVLNGKDLSSDKNNNDDNNVVVNNGDTVTPPAADAPIVINGLSDGDWVRGDKNAKITIVEFSDIDCPFCTRFHDTMNQVMKDYSGKVNWVYRHFPLTSLHPDAFKKAVAAECVGEQGGNDKFWSFLDKLFAEDETIADMADMAVSVGVDKTKFEECLASNKYDTKIQNQSSEAQKAGGRGTPYSVILSGSQKVAIPGALPYASVQASLDALLK
ncbi:MAG: thioredoxin domain-containing protein [Patescibacteria group bacterium]|jgi:protein-disulfide isomerase